MHIYSMFCKSMTIRIWVVEIRLFDFLLFIPSCGMYCQCAIIRIIICYKDLSKSVKQFTNIYGSVCCFKIADDVTQTFYFYFFTFYVKKINHWKKNLVDLW